MPRSVATIGVSVTARTSRFQRGMRNAQTSLQRFGASVRAIGARVAKYGAILAGVAAGAMTLFVKQSFSTLDSLAKASDRLGIAADVLRGFERAVELTGGTIEGLRKNIIMMIKNIGDVATGTGEAKDALAALRLDAAELIKLSPDEMLLRIADALQRIPTQTRRVFMASEIFGSRGVKELLNFLNLGPQRIREMVQESIRLSGSFNRIDLALIEQANDSFADLRRSLRAMVDQLAIVLAPTVEAVSNALITLATEGETTRDILVDAFSYIARAGGKVLDVIYYMELGFRQMAVAIAESMEWAEQKLTRFAAFMVAPEGPIGLVEGLIEKLLPDVAIGITALRAAGNAPTTTFTTGAADAARKALAKAIAEGLPSETLEEIARNLDRAARQTAAATRRIPQVPELPEVMPREVREARREAATQFIEIDVSRTLVSGLAAARRQKQKVQDEDALRELRLIRQNTGRGNAAIVGPG